MTPITNLFKPIPVVQRLIDNNLSKFSENTIGMHIRRTDHKVAKASASIDSFDNKIEELIKQDPSTRVFLCTDDEDVKSYLINKYGRDKILYYESVLDRNSYEGIRDAVVELWTLANTNVIYGSHGSSFTKMAAAIYGRKFYEVTDKK